MKYKLYLFILISMILISCNHNKDQNNIPIEGIDTTTFNKIEQQNTLTNVSWEAKKNNSLGTNELLKGNIEQAIEFYNKAIILDSNYSDPYSNRGACKYNLKYNFKETIKDFKKASELDSTNSIALMNIGILYAEQKDSIMTFRYLDKAMKTSLANPTWNIGSKPQILAAYGHYYYTVQNFNAALIKYEKAIEIIPKNAQKSYAFYFFRRGEIKCRLNKIDAGCIDLKTSIDLGYSDTTEVISQFCN